MTTTKRTPRKAAKRAQRTTRKATRKVAKQTNRARSEAVRSTKKAKKTARGRAASAKKAPRNVARRVTGAAKKGGATRKRTSQAATADAIALLKRDHRAVEQLFKRFEKAGDGAKVAKRRLVDEMTTQLSRHAEIEELIFYPAVRREVGGADSDVLEALEEHHVVKVVLRELEDMASTDERFDAKVTVMIENVRHHVKEEEQELFPEVRDRMSRRRLVELGVALREAKPRVPTRPHPNAPDEPPANALIGGAVAAVDRARTVGKKTLERVRDEVVS